MMLSKDIKFQLSFYTKKCCIFCTWCSI